MPRTIVMGDPAHFSVIGGANPHTRNALGVRKKVNAELARGQWHAMAQALIAHGCEVCVIAPDPELTGLVYPANAGFLYPLSHADARAGESASAGSKTFYLSNLLPTRAAEREVYRSFLRAMGYATADVVGRFEGEADFFPAGRFMLFTYGRIERQRFAMRLGFPPWRRIYGFRSEEGAVAELQTIVGSRPVVPLELCLEAHYHGDTVLCSFGPNREYLLAYMEGIAPAGRERLRTSFGPDLIELSTQDAVLYAANSFQVDHLGKFYLFMPEGVSDSLTARIRERGVEPVLVNVSEFLAKGGGSVKCMILDLGPRDEQPQDAPSAQFRAQRSYQRLYANQ